MFGNPLEDKDLDRETLAGWKTLIDNAHLFGTDTIAGFTGRVRGKPLTDSLPRFKEVWGELSPARRRQGREDRLRELRDGRQLGERRLEHRPQSRRLGADVRRAAERQSRARMGALPPARLSDRPRPADPQMGEQDLSRPRQGRDGALGRDPRARHFRKGAVRAHAHAGLRRQRLDARSSATSGSTATAARSTSRAGTIRSIARNSR